MSGDVLGFRELVERLGPHPVTTLGIDLDAAGGPERWLLAACLLAERGSQASALEAARRLAASGLGDPVACVGAGTARAQAILAAAHRSRPEATARRLARAGARLRERHGGSLATLASGADGLEELGARLAELAPGIGAATVLRFLRPLRERWPAARDVALDPAARAAARHLGWLAEGEDEEGAPGALLARLRVVSDAPPLEDIEAALGRLGTRSCRRERPERCPLADACPARRRERG